jgi:N-formylglutamate amidohydrolase
MKSRDTLIRLKKFQVDEKRRRVNQIEGMIADFQRMSVDLEREIQSARESTTPRTSHTRLMPRPRFSAAKI